MTLTDFDELDVDDTAAGAATQFANRPGAVPTSGLMGFFDDLLGWDMGKSHRARQRGAAL